MIDWRHHQQPAKVTHAQTESTVTPCRLLGAAVLHRLCRLGTRMCCQRLQVALAKLPHTDPLPHPLVSCSSLPPSRLPEQPPQQLQEVRTTSLLMCLLAVVPLYLLLSWVSIRPRTSSQGSHKQTASKYEHSLLVSVATLSCTSPCQVNG